MGAAVSVGTEPMVVIEGAAPRARIAGAETGASKP